jgi:hypothetical protein
MDTLHTMWLYDNYDGLIECEIIKFLYLLHCVTKSSGKYGTIQFGIVNIVVSNRMKHTSHKTAMSE